MMKNGVIGLGFCLISTILFCVRNISAAIFGSNLTLKDSNTFQNLITIVDSRNVLLTLSIIALLVGLTYLVLDLVKTRSN